MSTYYYLVCDECMESCCGASSSGSFGGGELIDSGKCGGSYNKEKVNDPDN